MAGRIVPPRKSLGSFRFGGKTQTARFLFYGERSLGRPVEDPREIVLEAIDDPGKVFVTTADNLKVLSEKEVQYNLKVLYRVGDLVLFNVII